MARIMIHCPTFDAAVPTGLTTEMIKIDSLDFTLRLRCPACQKIHKWERQDAWIEEGSDGPTEPQY